LRKLAIVGLFLTVIGLVLSVGFWPLTSVSGAQLRAARNGNQYTGYSPGTRITVHEKILSVTFTSVFGSQLTELELDDSDPSVTTSIYVRGDARAVVAPGDVIFASAVLQPVPFDGYYWEVASPGDVHQSRLIDGIFYGAMGAGVVVLAFAAFRRP
jgi:hypothetical protein